VCFPRCCITTAVYPVGHTGVWYRPIACMLPATVATDSRNIVAFEPRGISAAIAFLIADAWADLSIVTLGALEDGNDS
jgi:hypothetical protein